MTNAHVNRLLATLGKSDKDVPIPDTDLLSRAPLRLHKKFQIEFLLKPLRKVLTRFDVGQDRLVAPMTVAVFGFPIVDHGVPCNRVDPTSKPSLAFVFSILHRPQNSQHHVRRDVIRGVRPQTPLRLTPPGNDPCVLAVKPSPTRFKPGGLFRLAQTTEQCSGYLGLCVTLAFTAVRGLLLQHAGAPIINARSIYLALR